VFVVTQHRHRKRARALVATLRNAATVLAAITVVVCIAGVPGAAPQATTTQPVTTSAPTTTSPSTTTSTAASTTTAPVTSTTAPPSTSSSGDDDVPWIAIIAVVVALAVIILGIAALARDRGRRRATTAAWRRRAAGETAEIGATARLLAAGTPVSAAIVQEVLASLRTLDDLAQSAPDDAMRTTVSRAHQAVHTLGVAIDADNTARRAQPPITAGELEAAHASLLSSAADADSVLRSANRTLSG
jgi:hypothetical protein